MTALVLASLALAAVTASSAAPTRFSSVSARHGPGGPRYVEGEILVKFRCDAHVASRGPVRADVAGSTQRRFASGAELWRLGAGVAVQDALQRVKGMPGIEYAEPNWLLHATRIPNDPFFPQQYGLANTGQEGGEAGADIDAAGAWDISTGGASVIVAVVDTGIDLDHPDLVPNLWTNPDEIPGNLVDDDGNGRIDDVHGWDFVNDDGDPRDDEGHGTHVAGTIAAAGDNDLGVAGVAWRARLMALKILDASGTGTTSDAIQAIDYAAARGARILNASWGGGGFSMAMLESIRDAGAHEVLFVAAAGNDAADSDLVPFSPAGYDAPNVVAVAATDRHDHLAPFSNFGGTKVDLAAPGVDILSTLPGGTYGLSSGTSMATPHVSGIAALILGFAPGMQTASLRRRILENAEPVASLADKVATGARVNAFQCLLRSETVPPGPIVDLRVTEPLSDGLALAWTAPGDDLDSGAAFTYDLRVSGAPFAAAGFETAPRFPLSGPPRSAGSPETMEIGGLEPSRTYFLGLRAIDEWGNAGPPGFATATTRPPPAGQVTPESFSASLRSGAVMTTLLTMRNTGEGTLDWSAARP
ncbi:MAG TPA: S8 family serine peptidase, partial [Candidatus Polarisedimenticolia bacterium]|nr:S8 family serine peptidase [Candidatus Polarisedimenticolia bacterium]